jgi:WhiB family redox-sensing transcriptional regulator
MTVPYPKLTGREPCRSADPELFFPAPGDNAGGEKAKAICRPCPTRDACAAWAIDQSWWLAGVFGGLSPKDRQKRRMGRAA